MLSSGELSNLWTLAVDTPASSHGVVDFGRYVAAETGGRMPMLTIWGRNNSINVQKVLWCCAELGLEFRRIDAGLQYGVNNTPEYLANNPTGLVPTIDDDGYILWESNVIVRYLSSRHGLGTLCPADLQARFRAEIWMDWQQSFLWPSFRTVFQGLIRTPPEKRDNNAIAAAKGKAASALKILDRHLAGRDYVEGKQLTFGDIPVGIAAYRWFALGMPRDELPNMVRWHDRLAERPAFRQHVMLPLT
jgi:glutathione S-transferase